MSTCQQCGKSIRIRTSERKGDTYIRYYEPCRCGHRKPRSFASADVVKQRNTCKDRNRT